MISQLTNKTKKRTVYFGPPTGVYAVERFEDFVKTHISQRLEEIGSPSVCSVEEHGYANTTYHFPDAGIGLTYRLILKNRCMVDLHGTRQKELRDLTDFIFEQDQNL